MLKVQSGDATISYTKAGSGPTLVLVHGAFSDHHNFWQLASPALEKRFTVVAMERRGRGESSKTTGHSTEDEGQDVAAVINSVGGDVSLLAHSGGSFCSLLAAMSSRRVKKLILYEPPGPEFTPAPVAAQIEEAATRGDWDAVVESFLGDSAALIKPTPFFATMVNNADATLQDPSDFERFWSEPELFQGLNIPVLLLRGSETPDERCETSALSRVLPDSRVIVLEGQGHAAMLTAPALFVREVEKFLLGE